MTDQQTAALAEIRIELASVIVSCARGERSATGLRSSVACLGDRTLGLLLDCETSAHVRALLVVEMLRRYKLVKSWDCALAGPGRLRLGALWTNGRTWALTLDVARAVEAWA